MSEDASVTPQSQLPGKTGRGPTPEASEVDSRGAIAVGRVLRAMHRHTALILIVTTFTTTFALIAFRQPALYRASAVLRLAGERRAITPELDPNPDERHVVLVNSLVPRVRSRAVIGAVVDSLGLQLRPLPTFSLLHPPVQPAINMAGIRVDRNAPADTLTLLFAPKYLTVRHGEKGQRYRYGAEISVAGASFTVPRPPAIAGAVVAVVPRDPAVDRVLDQLAVVPLVGTDALEVRYIDTDPALAKAITNQVVRTFYASTINSSQEQARRRRLFLEGQLQESDRQLAQAQADLTGFRSRSRLARSADKLARQQSDLMSLDARRGELQADRRVFTTLLSRLQNAKDSSRSEQLYTLAYSPEIATDPIVGKVFQQLLSYGSRLDSLTSGPYQSSANNPDVLQLREMVKASEGELVRAVRGRLGSIRERLSALGDLRSRNAGELASMPMLEAEEARMSQKVSALSAFSDQLRLEYQKAKMSEALAATDIEIVDLATTPYLATGIPAWFKVALAFIAGLVISTVLSVLLELRNHLISGPEEIEEVLHLRGLGVIPPVLEAIAGDEALAVTRPPRKADGAGLRPGLPGVVSDSPVWPSAGAEAFRLLYSTLTYGWGARTRTLLVTSVAPQEGKTLVASNLAVTFAREGARVLLVDCDLRRPRLHKVFRVSRAPGVVELLRDGSGTAEDVEPRDDNDRPLEHAYSMLPDVVRADNVATAEPGDDSAARPTAKGNGSKRVPGAAGKQHRSASFRYLRETKNRGLWLLPCGAVDRNSSETLKANTVRTLLAELAGDFDVIILDTSPALVTADAVLLAPVADDVLLVVRAGYTDRDAAERAHQQLSDAGGNVVGAVLNDPKGKVARDRLLYYEDYAYPVTTD